MMRLSNPIRRIAAPVLALSLAAGVPAAPWLFARTGPVAAAAHERLLPLQGGRNFRDLGGYRTADGRSVKWGVLFRSGSMHGLTEADYRSLEARGIRVVCDFRDRRERAAEPVTWPAAGAPRVLSDDYDLDMRFLPAGSPKSWTPEQVRAAMTKAYPAMLGQFNGQYRRMFAELLAGHAPLAFNCSAGKDRTGIAAALLLTALGVPRKDVIADYLLTNRYLDASALTKGTPNPANPLAGLPPETAKPLMAADAAYIEAALAVVDGHKDGAKGYFRDELGLSAADLVKLRNAYLVRA
ncbi:tyrosine-protein phosphatase [Sphingomonas sp. H39-1-10]|uniref:tyrosine-protein phosphatase n=1 Tax=Sphingomonas pollutisoli TaxID=3030829 RepID=UPI0023B9A044|nr:tyrosine-protein phosphatase [Sphingomonas pollutisoli]MDF0486519.1 tyrosine-protein phosphatase [Sphingomonas pollutisoli]